MTTLSKITSIAFLLVAGVAQTTFAQTNVTMVLDIDLTAVSQGTTANSGKHDNGGAISDVQFSRITSRGIIQVLGASLGDSFSKRAQLIVIAPADSPENWTIQIQDGTNAPVDVTGFFNHQPGSVSVSGTTNAKHGNSTVINYSVDSLSLQDQSGFPALTEHFSVSGFTVIESGVVTKHKGTVIQFTSVSAQVSGNGDNQGNPTVITGSIMAESGGAEWCSTGMGD